MADSIKDKKANYIRVKDILSSKYDEVDGYEFYKYIFPDNQKEGELAEDYSKPNAIYLYRDEYEENPRRTYRRRIMLKDTWEEDYMEYVEGNPKTLCSGLAYRHRANRLKHAQHMNALVFDLDSVGENEIRNLLLRMSMKPGHRTLPKPTFIVMSGTGLHIYYVFDRPIELYPNIKLQLKSLKYDLTFKMWEYKATSQEKQIQYQSINQGFRMVGSINDKYDLPVIAFKTGDRVSLDYVNSYVDVKENMVDVNRPYRPTQYTEEEAKEKFPEWYERVVVQGDKKGKKWNIKRDLYDWWLRQSHKIKGGHRYFYLMCMTIYGVKCNIPKEEVKADMIEKFEELKNVEHSNELCEDDLYTALEVYEREFYNFTIDDIEKLTDIRIERNKRNYRPQEQHIRVMNAIRDTIYPNGEWRNKEGRPKGSGTKEEVVKDWREKNPEGRKVDCRRETKLDPKTIRKWW